MISALRTQRPQAAEYINQKMQFHNFDAKIMTSCKKISRKRLTNGIEPQRAQRTQRAK
jgi:hypothetical protein